MKPASILNPLTIIGLVTILQGCSYGQSIETKTFETFPIKETLEHSPVQIDEPITPRSIHLVENTIILIDRNSEYTIHLYDINNWKLKTVYGRRGDGPAEMRSPNFHGQAVKEGNDTYLWFSDIRNYKLKKISLEKMLVNESTEPDLSLKLPPELALAYKDVFAVNDSEFFGTVEGDIIGLSGNENAGRFFRFKTGSEISWIPNFPIQELEVPQNKIGYLYSSRVAFNPKTQQIASGMLYFDRVDYIDILNEKVITAVQESKVDTEDVNFNGDNYLIPPSVTNYHVSAYGTENFAYFFYSNATNQQAIDYYDGKISSFPNLELHVYDWKGNPVYKAELDKWALNSFFIDEDSWRLFAVDSDPEEEDQVIISYQLPNLQNE